MLKMAYSTVQSMKTVAVLTEDRAFALFFRPHPGNLPSKTKKKMPMPEGQAGGGVGGG